MFNSLKKNQKIPKFMNLANVTTVPKKGSKLLLQNERGFFQVSAIRSILMRLIYNEKYNTIDKNLSDLQLGEENKKDV